MTNTTNPARDRHRTLRDLMAAKLGAPADAIDDEMLEQIRGAVLDDVGATAMQPVPELDTGRLLDAEHFRLRGIQIAAALPDDPAFQVTVPQVITVLEGMPGILTLTGEKSYVTAFNGDRAIAAGKALLEAGKTVKQAEDKLRRELETTPIVAATPADMAAATAAARVNDDLRHGPRAG